MDAYKITMGNINLFDKALNDAFKWNANNDLLLYAFQGELHNVHYHVLHPLSFSKDNPTLNFEIIPCFGHQSSIEWYNLLGSEYHNIFMVTHFIENVNNDFLIIKPDNLNNYGFKLDKEIIIFELHTTLTSNNALLSRLDSLGLDFAYDTDFAKFNKVKTIMNGNIIELKR